MNTSPILKENIKASLGEIKADLVIKNANVLNVFTECFEQKDVAVKNGMIVGLGQYEGDVEIEAAGKAVVPGFIDGHMHLESSIVSPREYCRVVVPHGTTAVVADPHEITNVLGKTGFDYMVEETKDLPMDIYLMVPSCVPATPFDESGAVISAAEAEDMLTKPGVLGLAEMMNYPGVFGCDEDVLKKLEKTMEAGKVIDGHAPGISEKELNAYVTAGIGSDHECTTAEEAKQKIAAGQWVMIREGTACKNLESLLPLFDKPYCDRCLLVTDDKHSRDLKQEGHIDHIIRKAIAQGANPVSAYKMAGFNGAVYFGLKQRGAIGPGYRADFVILEDVNTVKIHSVYKNGRRVDDKIDAIIESLPRENPYCAQVYDTINMPEISAKDFVLKKAKEKVIGLVPGEILTTDEGYASEIDLTKDICKFAVLERHHGTGHKGIAFLKGYGLKKGAVATSIAHDSHNIIVVGTNEADMAFAVSEIKKMGGGMVVVEAEMVKASIPLPIAGLMCDLDAETTEAQLTEVKRAAYELGVSERIDPFMTLSFSSLAVIPVLRLTTRGVVDVTKFELVE